MGPGRVIDGNHLNVLRALAHGRELVSTPDRRNYYHDGRIRGACALAEPAFRDASCWLSWQLVREGAVLVRKYRIQDHQHRSQQTLRAAQRQAKRGEAGLWAGRVKLPASVYSK